MGNRQDATDRTAWEGGTEGWKRSPGRPKVETPKVHVGFRLAADVVDGIKGTGKGYNARVETVLREALAAGKLDAPATLFDAKTAQQ